MFDLFSATATGPVTINWEFSWYLGQIFSERQIDINSINKRALQLIRELSNSIAELSNSIEERSYWIGELSNFRELSIWIAKVAHQLNYRGLYLFTIRELSNSIRELFNSIKEL